MQHRLTSALLATVGIALIVVCNFAIERHSVAPVPVSELGLPVEAVEPFKQFVASLPPLQIVGASTDEDNRARRVVLDSHLLRVGHGEWPWHGPQETGDCAAQAIAGAIEIDIGVRTEQDQELVWRPVDRGAIYGGGRVTIGKGAIKGAGLVPSWGLEYVDRFGILWRDEPGVPAYTGRRIDEWGRNGVPPQFLDRMKPFAGLQFAACRSAQDVCNANNAGCPVVFGSMKWGTNRIKIIEGRNLAFDTTDWPHAQIITGYDGTLSNGQRMFRVLNSWGPNAHSPKSQMPGDHPGGYYVTWETVDQICREGMTFAVSGANGFRQRNFVPDFSVIGVADLPLEGQQENAAMFEIPASAQMPGTVLGIALVVIAIVLLCLRGNVGRRLGAAALLAVVSASAIVHASEPDFTTLTRAAQLTPTIETGETYAPRFAVLTEAAQHQPAVKASKEATKPVATLWTMPNCGPCVTVKGQLATIQALSVKEVQESAPPYSHGVYPVLTMPGKQPLVGAHSAAAIKRWAGVK